jgi:hypothetical protein
LSKTLQGNYLHALDSIWMDMEKLFSYKKPSPVARNDHIYAKTLGVEETDYSRKAYEKISLILDISGSSVPGKPPIADSNLKTIFDSVQILWPPEVRTCDFEVKKLSIPQTYVSYSEEKTICSQKTNPFSQEDVRRDSQKIQKTLSQNIDTFMKHQICSLLFGKSFNAEEKTLDENTIVSVSQVVLNDMLLEDDSMTESSINEEDDNYFNDILANIRNDEQDIPQFDGTDDNQIFKRISKKLKLGDDSMPNMHLGTKDIFWSPEDSDFHVEDPKFTYPLATSPTKNNKLEAYYKRQSPPLITSLNDFRVIYNPVHYSSRKDFSKNQNLPCFNDPKESELDNDLFGFKIQKKPTKTNVFGFSKVPPSVQEVLTEMNAIKYNDNFSIECISKIDCTAKKEMDTRSQDLAVSGCQNLTLCSIEVFGIFCHLS